MHFFINVRSSGIHGIRFGSGNQLLICLHGFGEDAEKFRALHSGLSDRYTLIAIDLPLHGNTKWQQDELFLQEDLKFLIKRILEREQCKRFSLMGYSLGGKLVLSAILNFASQLDSIILIAPDGVKANAWYNIPDADAAYTKRPRSATVVITRTNGGEIAADPTPPVAHGPQATGPPA